MIVCVTGSFISQLAKLLDINTQLKSDRMAATLTVHLWHMIDNVIELTDNFRTGEDSKFTNMLCRIRQALLGKAIAEA